MQLDTTITLDPAAAQARTSDFCALTSGPARSSVIPNLSTESRTSSPVAPRPEVTHDEPRSIGPVPSDSVASPSDPAPAPAPSPSVSSAPSAVNPSSAPSADSERIRSQRLAIIRTVDAYRTQHSCSVSAACHATGISQSTYSRHAAALRDHGLDGLLGGYDRCGRQAMLDLLCPDEDRNWLIHELQSLNGLTHGAQTAANIIARNPDCPESISAYLRRTRRIPQSFLRAARIPHGLRERFKGPRAYQHASIVNLRKMTEILPDGTEVVIRPGDWWELDDMSINTPFWFEVPAGCDDRAATVDGIALGRQGLYCRDLASGKWLGHLLIGRPRDAYRAEDILRYLKMIMMVFGKPRRGLRIERNVWESKCITGYDLSAPASRSGPFPMADADLKIIVAGIRDLGINVDYCYTSRDKGAIEGAFKHLQDLMAASRFANIGRIRGEGEAATAALIHAKAGRSHPSARGFAHIEEASQLVTWAETFDNTSHKNGRLVKGIPDERWLASVTLDPLLKLTENNHAVFLPDRSIKQISGGHITPTRGGITYQFYSPLFAELGNGTRVLFAFDPSEPELGAGLWKVKSTSTDDEIPVGEFLGWATYEPLSPQFGASPDPRARQNRKEDHNWHRTAFAALQPGKDVETESTHRDGKGNTTHVTRDQAVPARTPAPARSRTSSPAVAATPGAPTRNSSSIVSPPPDAEEPVSIVRIIHRNPKPADAIHFKRIYH